MEQTGRMRKLLAEALAIILVGAGVGWLIGQSVTPMLQTVLASILTVISALLVAVMGLNAKEDASGGGTPAPGTAGPRNYLVSAVPLALFLTALCIASAVSVAVRARAALGMGLDEEIAQWAAVGMNRQEVARRLFEARVPDASSGELPPMLGRPPKDVVEEWKVFGLKEEEVARVLFQRAYGTQATHAAPAVSPASVPVLYAGPDTSECARLKQAGAAQLPNAMQGSPNAFIRELVQSARAERLVTLVELLCGR